MFASQLIYTACGKDRTGAFSVWAKSLDITKAEEHEIREKMQYKRPVNLPFEPTPEEIETLFPKKFGYFYLSSGRVCLAQSVYVGDVYSDLDQRTGNYIIHAFVFDKDDEIIPMNFFDSDLFKRSLTYEEWHEQDAPDDLPKVEILNSPGSLTKQEVDAFFDEARIERLKLLLQAIINASATEQKVTFNDVHSNLKYWYKAICVCLPKYMQKSLTFCTFFTPSMPLPSQNQAGGAVPNTEIKIRNIAPTTSSSIFSYQQDVRAGRYSFDFESGLLPTNLEVGPYVHHVADLLKTNIFNTVMLVDSVGKISTKCNVDLDTALDIHFLLNKEVSRVDDIDKLNRLVQYAKDAYPESLPDIADCLYEYGLQSGRWSLGSALSELYRFVFDYAEAADKRDMILQYIVNQRAFGVDPDVDCDAYCASFKRCVPFAWVNFLDYLFDDPNFAQYFDAAGMSFNCRYLIFNTFAESMAEIANVQEQKTVALRYLVDTVKYYIQMEQLDEVLLLLKCMSKCGAKWQGWLVEKTYSVLRKDGKRLTDVSDPGFTLSLAETCGDMGIAQNLISQLISENEQDNEFIKLYVQRYDRNASFYSAVFESLRKDAKYAAFLGNVELYRFAMSPMVTRKQLQNYYTDYFTTGKDTNGLFVKKLKQYLSGYTGKECIRECFACYDLWLKDAGLDENVLVTCVSVVCDAFFAVSVEVLREYIAEKGTQKIKELLAPVANTYRAPNHYYVIAFGEWLKYVVEEIRTKKNSPQVQDTLNKLSEDTFYRLPQDDQAKDLFVKLYLPDVIRLYALVVTVQNFEDVYCRIFQPLSSAAHFGQCFYGGWKSMKEKDADSILADTIVYACNKSDKFTECLMRLVESILEEVGRGKRKKFFAQLLNGVPPMYEKKTRAFVEGYQKQHEGFFDRLFGSFGKKEEGGEPAPQEKKKWKK